MRLIASKRVRRYELQNCRCPDRIRRSVIRNDVQIALRYGVMPIEQRRELLERAYARMGLNTEATP